MSDQPSSSAPPVLLIGWWLTGRWLPVAWLLNVTSIGIPLAVWMYNKLSVVVSLSNY